MKILILPLACIVMLFSCQQKNQQLSEEEIKKQVEQELRDHIEREYAEKELEKVKRELEQTKQKLVDAEKRQNNKKAGKKTAILPAPSAPSPKPSTIPYSIAGDVDDPFEDLSEYAKYTDDYAP